MLEPMTANNNLDKELYKELSTDEAIRGSVWWKVSVWTYEDSYEKQ
jgi:hypothetical protein